MPDTLPLARTEDVGALIKRLEKLRKAATETPIARPGAMTRHYAAETQFMAEALDALPLISASHDDLVKALESILGWQPDDRQTVTPENAFDEFSKANATLCAIFETAELALARAKAQGGV
jgi:hypothetical protein